MRPVIYPATGTIQGTWTAQEVAAAAQAGARVRVLDAWVHFTDSAVLPFAGWWKAVQEGRAMPGYAGTLAKMTGNALVGQFHIDPGGRRAVLTYSSGRRRIRLAPRKGGRPRAYDLAETVTGRVRARLWSELLLPAGPALLACHTDGGWVAEPGDWSPGEDWRARDVAEVVDIVDYQHLAYTRPGSDRTAYKMAGSPPWRAERDFDEMWRSAMRVEPRRTVTT